MFQNITQQEIEQNAITGDILLRSSAVNTLVQKLHNALLYQHTPLITEDERALLASAGLRLADEPPELSSHE